MYEELMKRLREVSGDARDTLLWKAADAIEERDKYALSLQQEMMAEAESHIEAMGRLNKQIEELQKKYAEVLKAAKSMHIWIFLNSEDEQAAYDECGLTDEMNATLGYCGQFILKAPKEEKK